MVFQAAEYMPHASSKLTAQVAPKLTHRAESTACDAPLDHTLANREDADWRYAAELLDATAEEVRWESGNLERIVVAIGELEAHARAASIAQPGRTEGADPQIGWFDWRRKSAAALVDAGLLLDLLRRGGAKARDAAVTDVQRRLGGLVDDAIELSQRLRPRLATALSWWLARLREDLQFMRRCTLRELPRGPRFQAEALAASLEACVERLFGRGRLNLDLQNGAVVEQAVNQLRELWQPLAPVAYLARLCEQVSRIAEEPYGSLWVALQAAPLAAPYAEGYPGPGVGRAADCKWWEGSSRQVQVRNGCEAILRELCLTSLARIEQTISGGASASKVATCAGALRVAWVETWTEVRVLSRDIQPLHARESWLQSLDEAMRSSVTLAGRIELHLRGTCASFDVDSAEFSQVYPPTQPQIDNYSEL